MDFLKITIVNCILVVFPILLYFIYLIYNYEFSKKANELILDICLITSYYLTYKFSDDLTFSSFLLSIPLLCAYLRERKISIIILSFIALMDVDSNLRLTVLAIEKISFYIFYLTVKEQKNFKIAFWTIKTFGVFVLMLDLDMTLTILIEYAVISIAAIIFSNLIISLFSKTNKIISMYMNLNDIKKENKIQESLFKITHEIKNPIAVCKGYLDMYDCNNLDHSQRFIPIIKSEIERTLILLQDFLCLRKIKINKEVLDLTMLLDETIEEMQFYNGKKIEYVKKYDSEDEIYLDGDYNRLKQVFVNIIKNSVEALENEGRITVKVVRKKSEIHLTFKDNGIGMSAETLSKIKEPFFTTKPRGTGLGVPLSIEIVEAHGWEIEYSSKMGEGTLVGIIIK